MFNYQPWSLALQNPLGKEILFVVFCIPSCSFIHLFIPYVLSVSWILQTIDHRNLQKGLVFIQGTQMAG